MCSILVYGEDVIFIIIFICTLFATALWILYPKWTPKWTPKRTPKRSPKRTNNKIIMKQTSNNEPQINLQAMDSQQTNNKFSINCQGTTNQPQKYFLTSKYPLPPQKTPPQHILNELPMNTHSHIISKSIFIHNSRVFLLRQIWIVNYYVKKFVK